MKNVLIIAFSCLPNRGSEPGVGWNWSIVAAEAGYNVITLTREKCRKKIEPEIPEALVKNLSFEYCESSAKLRRISIYLEYIDWQRRIKKIMPRLLREKKIDVVWFLTWGNMFLPTGICEMNIPIIWGPVGGGEAVPEIFWREWSLKDRFPQLIRKYMIQNIKYNRFIIGLANKSWKIIARTPDTKKVFPALYQSKISIKLETCLDYKKMFGSLLNDCYQKEDDGKLRIVYTGRLIPLKNVDMLIKAFDFCQKNSNTKIELLIIGDGENKLSLEELTAQLKCENVTFFGNISHEELLEVVKQCDIFAFPSLKEGASWSILEAMALRIPVLCFNLSGMASTTDDSCASRVDITDNDTIETIQEKFNKALLELIQKPSAKRKNMGEMGRQRILEEFTNSANITTVKSWLE